MTRPRAAWHPLRGLPRKSASLSHFRAGLPVSHALFYLIIILAAGHPAISSAANAFDREIMEFVQDHRSHNLDHLMTTLSAEWNKENFVLASLPIIAWGDEKSFSALEACAKSIAISEMIVSPLKYAIGRKRPTGTGPRGNSSFPSSHAATAFAAASCVGHAYPRMKIPAYSLATLIAYSRIYSQRHYASDVIAGACIGVLSAEFSRAYLAWLHVDRADLARRLPFRIAGDTDGRGLVRIYFSARM